MAPAPITEAELLARAERLAGMTLADLARELGVTAPDGGPKTKGKVGELIERALGATAGTADIPDFPHLGIELKTIPVDETMVPRESTFVCTISLADADRQDWVMSRARAKLSHVLFVPIVGRAAHDERRVGRPLVWQPSKEQESILRGDFDELIGLIGIGGIEAVSAHAGRYLQVRPKAASGRVRTRAFGPDGEWIDTVPRGFYLRARFTRALLADPLAVP
jgi:DNA mismatch repair protein MutH